MKTFGTPVVSAVITTKSGKELKSVQIAKDDELSNLTLKGFPEDVVIESATVKGFQLSSLRRPTGSGPIFDGIPSYIPDPDTADVNPGSLDCMAEETTQVNRIIVEIPAEEEDGDPQVRTILVSSIRSFEGGTPIESSDEEEGDTKPEDGEDGE